MQLHDTATLQDAKVRYTSEGYLVAQVRVARTGIQDYNGSELGRPDLGVVRVWRPEAEVFADAAMKTYAHRPVVNGHQGTVTADNWKEVSVGQTGHEVVRDGQFVSVPMVMMDAKAIADFKAGKREVSMGYSTELIFQDGITPDGEPYNAVATNMRMNHLALEHRARGGSALRIGDGGAPQDQAPRNPDGGPKMAETRKVVFDGLTIETTEHGAQVIEKLTAKVADMRTAADGARTAHEAALADANIKLAKAEAERDAAKAKVLDDAAIDKLVADRAALLSDAKSIHEADYSGKTPAEVRRAVVAAKLGDAAVAGKSDTYVDVRFDDLLADAKRDPVSHALRANDSARPLADNGQAAYEAKLADRWKSKAAA